MRRRYVVILFQHHLFGEAIARALGENDHLNVTTLALEKLSAEALQTIHPDALVLEGPITGDVANALLGVAPALTIVVGPESNIAQAYEGHEVFHATAAEIRARIMAGSGPKRATAARRRLRLSGIPCSGNEDADRTLLAELHAHRPARGSRPWMLKAMATRGSRASPADVDRILREMRQEGCSICGENLRAHRLEVHAKEEHRRAEPQVVWFEGADRSTIDCPYCGAVGGSADEGWVHADLPRQVYAECCGSGWYEIVARKRTPSNPGP
ncbi:MAG: hypothetical protein HY873_02400 [Chloroflexi bacterium]|nr:hypothetical protein [Chloroflexota bacterium]